MSRTCWNFIKAGGISVLCVWPLFFLSKHSFSFSATHEEKLEKNKSRTAWAKKTHITKMAVASMCKDWLAWKAAFSACANACEQMGVHHYFKYLAVQAKSGGVIISRTVTKLDCCLPAMPVQNAAQPSRQQLWNRVGTGAFFWRTKSSGQLPRGLIRDYVWWVVGVSRAQQPNTQAAQNHARMFLSYPHTFIRVCRDAAGSRREPDRAQK